MNTTLIALWFHWMESLFPHKQEKQDKRSTVCLHRPKHKSEILIHGSNYKAQMQHKSIAWTEQLVFVLTRLVNSCFDTSERQVRNVKTLYLYLCVCIFLYRAHKMKFMQKLGMSLVVS